MAKITSITKNNDPIFSDISAWHSENMHSTVIDFKDPKPYEVYAEGKWCGVFQCVKNDTLVSMSDNTQKQIKDIKIGDSVKCYSDGKFVNSVVDAVYDQGVKDCIELSFDNNKKLVCTVDHLIMTQRGWVRADSIVCSDLIVADQGFIKYVSSNFVGRHQVYDIEVRDVHNFIANDIVVHNCTGDGAQKFFIKNAPKSIIDIAALTSIYRPGPLAGKVDVMWKEHETVPFDWGHPLINDVLKETRGCLAEGTLVLTKNGEIPIEQIVDSNAIGTKIISYNETICTFEDDEIVAVADNGIAECLIIETEAGNIELTPDHRVLTSTRGWQRADELLLTDEIITIER
jgi:hypothetical protein